MERKGFYIRSLPGFAGAAFLVVAASPLFFLSGCAQTAHGAREAPPVASGAIVWPLPPESPRIGFVRTLERPEDAEGKKSLFGRIVDVILGLKSSRIIKPYGIAVDSTGRVIVADTAYRKVHVFDPVKKKYRVISKAGRREFSAPIGVAVDSLDNIYVSDTLNGAVFVLDAKGGYVSAITGMARPTGIAINKTSGLLYVVDSGEHNVKVFDLKGSLVKTFGKRGTDDGQFNYPVDISVDANGDVYVSDSLNFRLQIFDRDGGFITGFGRHGDGTGNMARPKGVAVDKDGNIYVVDAVFDAVQIFDREGKLLLNFGSSGNGPGQFWIPAGIFIDDNSRVYVADSYNRRVQVFEYFNSN